MVLDMEWIECIKELPEYMETCIIYAQLGFVTMAQYSGDKTIFCVGDIQYNATHWMPLPEPPKQ